MFYNNVQLEDIDISRNELAILEKDIFAKNSALEGINLAYNNIYEVNAVSQLT